MNDAEIDEMLGALLMAMWCVGIFILSAVFDAKPAAVISAGAASVMIIHAVKVWERSRARRALGGKR